MESENYKNINDTFTSLREQLHQINKFSNSLDFSPLIKAHKDLQSTGIVAGRMIEQIRIPLLEFNKSIKSSIVLDAFNHLNTIKTPLIDIQETFRLSDISGAITSINRLSNVIHSSYLKEFAELKSTLNQIHLNLDLSGLKQTIESINSITLPVVDLSKQIQSMNLSKYNLDKLIPDTRYVFGTIIASIDNMSSFDISILTEKLNEMKFEEIDVDNDGTVNFRNELYSREEVQEIVNKAINDSGLLFQQESENIDTLISEIQRNRQPLYQQILINLLCGVILFLATPILQSVQESVSSIMIENKTKIVKLIKSEYQSLKLQVSEKNRYRLVKTESMVVRITNKKNSQSVGEVYFGTVVKVLYKNKNWSLIEYENENEQIVTGWVYTRYLEKLNK